MENQVPVCKMEEAPMYVCSTCGIVTTITDGVCDDCYQPSIYCDICSKIFRVSHIRRHITIYDPTNMTACYCLTCDKKVRHSCTQCGRPSKKKYESLGIINVKGREYTSVYSLCSLNCKRLARSKIAQISGDVIIKKQ